MFALLKNYEYVQVDPVLKPIEGSDLVEFFMEIKKKVIQRRDFYYETLFVGKPLELKEWLDKHGFEPCFGSQGIWVREV